LCFDWQRIDFAQNFFVSHNSSALILAQLLNKSTFARRQKKEKPSNG